MKPAPIIIICLIAALGVSIEHNINGNKSALTNAQVAAAVTEAVNEAVINTQPSVLVVETDDDGGKHLVQRSIDDEPALDGPPKPMTDRFIAALEAQAFAQGKLAQELNEFRAVVMGMACTEEIDNPLYARARALWLSCASIFKES